MLQLVLSRAGYGKTEYVFSSIKKLVENGEENLLLITPEQYSFVAEQRLLRELGEAKISRVESTSFTRLSREVFSKFGGNELPVLSNGAKAVKMKEAIEAVQDSLVLFNKNKTTLSFINSLISVYDEMKSCRVSCEDILKARDNTEKEILKRKLSDVSLIISTYDALINNEYYDPANELTRLYERLLKLTYFNNRTVFIDGFNGFVAQEYKILEVILQQAKKVFITFCSDSYLNTDKYDLFSYVNSNIQILRSVTKKADVKFLTPIFLDTKSRFKNEELKYAEKYVFSNIRKTYDGEIENIRIFSARNICDECDNVAYNVSKLLRKGYRARDIAVICRDMERYERELSFSFKKFNVPYFDDERQKISSQPLIMLVNFLLRTVIYSYRSEDIFSLLKTGLTGLENDDINELENYVYLWNIKGSKWKHNFENSTKGFVEEISENDAKRIHAVNESRKYIVLRVEGFSKKCKDSTVKDLCKALYRCILDFKADKKLRALAIELEKEGKSALASEQGRIWDMLIDILDMLALVYGHKKVTVTEFYKLFNLMIMNEDLGTLPMGLDNVQLGSADRIRCNNPRAVFVVGANEGEFPKNNVSSGIFSESDRIALTKSDFKLYYNNDNLNAQEKYFAYMAISSACEKLFVSYINSGENATPSSIVIGLKSVFPKIKEEKSSKAYSVDKLQSKENAFSILASGFNENSEFISTLKQYFENDSEYSSRYKTIAKINSNLDVNIENSETAKQLFGNNMYLSASRIDDFYNCSFKYFCKFGLNARPRNAAKMDALQTGTVVHFVLEHLISETGSKGLTSLNDGEITLKVNEILKLYLTTMMGKYEEFTTRFKYQFMRLSKMIIFVVLRLKREFENSDFESKAFELKIGDVGADVPSKTVMLPDGGSIKIRGAVDRVDTYEENGVKYIRVVDYKSKDKAFNLGDVLYGLNLQMLIYLFTLSESKTDYSGVSSGVLYMNSGRTVKSASRNEKVDKLIKADEDNYKMNGIVLNDDQNEIAKHMEKSLKGIYIPARYDEKTDSVTGNIVTLEELGMISRKIDSLIASMGISLHNGAINQNPINGGGHYSACTYCDYKPVCLNRIEITEKELVEYTNDEAIDIMKEEQDA